jgi:NitT/TauT family transport system substrate-binding protein
MLNRILNRLLCGLLAIGLVLVGAAAEAQTSRDMKLVLDWTWQGNHAFFTLADDNGHFGREGLKVRIDRGFGSGDTIAKVAAGTYDIGFGDVNLLVPFNAKNPDNKVICVMMLLDGSLNAIVTRTSSGIRSPKDLEGRKIAAPVNDNSRLLFPIFAKANGVDESKITWLSVQPNVRDGLLVRGETDAVASLYTSTLLALEALGISRNDLTMLRYSEFGADLYGMGLMVSEKFLEANPEAVRAFLRATVRGTRDTFADTRAAIASLRKRDSLLSEATELTRLEMIRDLAVLTRSVKANGLSSVDPARLERTIGFVAQSMSVPNPPVAKDVYRGDYLPPLADRRF